jgi:tetratricopeptide (TPR) repeat protein
MSEIPDFTRNVSLRLSKVLDEIGVNERMVKKRRRLEIMYEALLTIGQKLSTHQDVNIYILGSKVEGTTTVGLNSDIDVLLTLTRFNVIQDWSEWELGKINLLMIQDDTVSPGYCLLQTLRQDAPLPEEKVYDQRWYRDRVGRVLLKNSIVNPTTDAERVRHGPAQSIDEKPGFYGNDIVLGFSCQQWPLQARQWMNQQSEGQWPTYDMKQYCKDTGCFVVGVGRKGSVNEELEWRISTSLAERFLMLSLNITQIRCYVLMKMIMKTFITTQCPDSISSFMCKTVLLHCIKSTINNAWKENTLLICLNYCLTILYNCVVNEYCPHFIIPENNLMARRFTPVTKQIILDRLSCIISSNGSALLEIECDQLGFRIQNTFLRLVEIVPEYLSCMISGQLVKDTAHTVNDCVMVLLTKMNKSNPIRLLLKTLYKYLMKVTHHMNQVQQKLAYRAIAKCLSMHSGSALASINLQSERSVCRGSFDLMTLGLNIDVASGKLKLASIFYCTGDIERAEIILKNIEENYDLSVVEPICKCYDFQHCKRKWAFHKLCYEANDEYALLQSITAFCVRFLRCEINCCPKELQHEMFRSSQEDFPNRSFRDEWMDLAVVDSLPYLYFLQYKTYSHLSRHVDKQVAKSNLAKCIVEEPNFGHKETALNLLGQCMEQENRIDAALKCYLLSLKIRDRNNAAKFHICRLVSSMLRPGLH